MSMKKLIAAENIAAVLLKKPGALEKDGIRLFTARTTEEIFSIHSREQCDLIIADLDMPGPDVASVFRLIRNDRRLRYVSLIAVCKNSRSDIERCGRCGANAFVTQPLTYKKLMSTAHVFLEISAREPLRELIKVSVDLPDSNNFFFAESRNISATGLLLRTDRALEKGAPVRCTFFLQYPVTLEGKVVRVAGAAPDSYEYGIRFHDIGPELTAEIVEFIKNRKPAQKTAVS